MSILSTKCPNCGAPINFNKATELWECIYCGSKYKQEEMQKLNASVSKIPTTITTSQGVKRRLEEMILYHCVDCKADIMADESNPVETCAYCTSTNITKSKTNEGVAPTKIIPFKITEEEAIKKFQAIAKKRPLMPQVFNDPDNLEFVKGIYIPFWTYDIETNCKMNFTATDKTTWKDSGYTYEKLDKYLVKNEGSMSFSGIITDASTHFDDNLMDSLEPFDFNELVDYNPTYLTDYLVEKYDIESNETLDRAKTKAIETSIEVMKTAVKHQNKNIDKQEITATKVKEDYIFLPFFMANIKRKGKIYTFAINGQTGKVVCDIPLSKKRTVILSIILFLVSFFIILIIM